MYAAELNRPLWYQIMNAAKFVYQLTQQCSNCLIRHEMNSGMILASV